MSILKKFCPKNRYLTAFLQMGVLMAFFIDFWGFTNIKIGTMTKKARCLSLGSVLWALLRGRSAGGRAGSDKIYKQRMWVLNSTFQLWVKLYTYKPTVPRNFYNLNQA